MSKRIEAAQLNRKLQVLVLDTIAEELPELVAQLAINLVQVEGKAAHFTYNSETHRITAYEEATKS